MTEKWYVRPFAPGVSSHAPSPMPNAQFPIPNACYQDDIIYFVFTDTLNIIFRLRY